MGPSASYRNFGVGLHSEIELPELKQQDVPRDVLLRCTQLQLQSPDPHSTDGWFRCSPERTELVWPRFASIRVERGCEIAVDPAPGVDPAHLRSVLLGQVSSFLFAQRGYLPLHASAVELGERTFALTAESGVGKSSAALALLGRGARLISDDLLPVDLSRGGVHVSPGAAILKLSPASRAASPLDLKPLPIAYAREDKCAFRAAGPLNLDARPLAGLLFLESGDEFSFEPLRGPEALFLLQGACHRRDALPASVGGAEWLRRTAQTLERLPTARLRWVRDLDRIDEMAERTEGALGRW